MIAGSLRINTPEKQELWSGFSPHDHSTIGYASATQSRDGVIHLMTSMNHPNLHFEMNEAWMAWIDRKNPPTRACVAVELGSKTTLVEIVVTAAK